jgi:hypothetical protein
MKPKFEDSHIPSSPDPQPELYRGVSEFMQNFSPSTQKVKEILSRESLDDI